MIEWLSSLPPAVMLALTLPIAVALPVYLAYQYHRKIRDRAWSRITHFHGF